MMNKQELSRWKHTSRLTPEDKLLLNYWEQSGGVIFAEVGKSERRIDAVRIVNPSLPKDIVYWHGYDDDELRKALYHPQTTAVEVIEMKNSSNLHDGAFGQAIAGQDLLEEYYPRLKRELLNKVILCIGVDVAMKRICEKYDIRIWTPTLVGPKGTSKPRQPKKDIGLLLNDYLTEFGGQVFSGVTVFGRWIDAIRVFPTVSSQLVSLSGQYNLQKMKPTLIDSGINTIEIIKAMPGNLERRGPLTQIERKYKYGHFGRSAFGQLIAEAELFEMTYQDLKPLNPAVITKVLIRTWVDTPMEKICEKHGIKVWPPRSDSRLIQYR